jgi:hypothetical protein
MLQVRNIVADCELGLLAPDVPKLVHIVDRWATDRPILRDLALYGERIRRKELNKSPLQLAVRFDDRHMSDGFDDWIEQLRTNFAGLAAMVGEPVAVLTPDMKSDWTAVQCGKELRVPTAQKVRIITTPAAPMTPPGRTKAADRSTFGAQCLRLLALS